MSFSNKVVIVTGASSGIGAATAVAFSAEGSHVVLVAIDHAKLQAVAKKFKDPLVVIADVAKDDDLRRIIEQTISKFGQLDVLVNNAGTAYTLGSILDGVIMKYYDYMMAVNLRAIVHLTSLASPHLVKTKGNIVNIVNISSVAGIIPITSSHMARYQVSKAALNHFTKCAANELGQHGIRVNVISPGPVVTDMLENANFKGMTWDDAAKLTLLNRVALPEEIADLILFLASDRARSITGSNYVSDNGVFLKRS